MSQKKIYYIVIVVSLILVSSLSVFLFIKKDSPEKAVQEVVSSILNKDPHSFYSRTDIVILTNYIYSNLALKSEVSEENLTPFDLAILKVTKKLMIFFAPSNKEEVSDLINDYLYRDEIPNSSLFNKERVFEFLDNIEKNSISLRLLQRTESYFKVKLTFYQKVIDQKLSVDFGFQLMNGSWMLTEIDGIQRLSTVYSSKRHTLMAQKFREQQDILKRHLLVEEIIVNANKDLIGSFFRVKIKIKNIGKEDIFGYKIKIGYLNESGKMDPYEPISELTSISPGESKIFYFEPKIKLLEFKMANNRGQDIYSEISYINLENETLKSFEY